MQQEVPVNLGGAWWLFICISTCYTNRSGEFLLPEELTPSASNRLDPSLVWPISQREKVPSLPRR